MKIKLSLFFILVASQAILGQETGRTVLKGKISANIADIEGVYVINLKTEKSTITEKDGQFSIAAIPGDTLLFSSIQFKEIRVVVSQKDFQEGSFLVKMESNITQLKEVVVKRYDNINAVALGISPKGIIHRTQAERKLYTANSSPAVALLNIISGRMAMLKKGVVVEGKWSSIDQIDNMFGEDYFRKTLKIPVEYVKGFKYYIVEDQKFTNVLKTKNQIEIELLMVPLAVKYNEIILNEK